MKLREDTASPANTSDRTVLIDLFVVVVIAVTTAALVYSRLDVLTPLRSLLGLVSVLLLPGYVTLAAVLRSQDEEPDQDLSGWVGRSETHGWSRPPWAVDGPVRLERLVLSFLISMIVVPLLGILLSLSSIEIRPDTIVLVVTGYTLLVAVVAGVRRLLSPETGRSPFRVLGPVIGRVKSPPTKVDALLNLTLAFLLIAAASVVAVPSVGQDESRFTEFYVLSGTESDDPVMSDYFATNDTGGPGRILTGITNREGRRVTYTVVVQVQRAEVRDRAVRVDDRRRISSFSTDLGHNETVRIPYDFDIEGAGTGCRVTFLLYRGDVPASPTVENAYRELHLWDAETPPPEGPTCLSLDAIDAQVIREDVELDPDVRSRDVDRPTG